MIYRWKLDLFSWNISLHPPNFFRKNFVLFYNSIILFLIFSYYYFISFHFILYWFLSFRLRSPNISLKLIKFLCNYDKNNKISIKSMSFFFFNFSFLCSQEKIFIYFLFFLARISIISIKIEFEIIKINHFE